MRVTLVNDGQSLATAPGAWVETRIKYPEDEALFGVNREGSKSLMEFRCGRGQSDRV